MSDVLPNPLAPPWLDLSNHDWFPLYFDRLRKSKWWRRASDVARARNIMLWGEAYKQVPAGTMPDDDDELAEAAGYGMDVDAFLAAKDDIMAPWVLCSDGRWHHPTVIEMAQESWGRMSEKRQKERIRKAEQRAAARSKTQGVPQQSPPVPPETAPVPQDNGTCPTGHPLFGGGTFDTDRQTDRTGQLGSNEPVASASPKTTSRAPKGDPWDDDPMFAMLWDAATAAMRRRAKSRANVWPYWVKAKKIADPETILQGLGIYLLSDPDVQRTGGPGLHLWLRDRTWENWTKGGASATATIGADWSDDTWAGVLERWRAEGWWDARLGPEPGRTGCLAPSHLLKADGASE